MRCDQCKYWEQTKENLGLCIKPKCLWDVTVWNDDDERVFKEGFENLKMFVQDGSDYAAYLYTKPDFFCAHYEIKND